MVSQKATVDELSRLAEELKNESLCFEDINKPNIALWIYREDSIEVGFYGFEICGSDALLRSVVVKPERRSHGIGAKIVRDALAKAADLGIKNLYLLTFSAKDFFAKQGFQVIERNSVPTEIAATEEFATFCPDTAVCMMKTLKK